MATVQYDLPVVRQQSSMVYDDARSKIVLFGGLDTAALSDTWEWDGLNWDPITTATTPPARFLHQLAYDSTQSTVLLFGGNNGSTQLADTFEYDGTNWTSLSPGSSPTAREDFAMAYDASRNVVVLFGGFDGGSKLSDTWEWNGTTWTVQSPSTVPPARTGSALVFDSVLNRIVMFGGLDNTSTYLQDTWVYDGTDWTLLSPVTKPTIRQRHAMVYATDRRRVVLFGGDASGSPASDVWEFVDGDWVSINILPVSPSARQDSSFAWDSTVDRMVLFGGFSTARQQDTWEYEATTQWKQLSFVFDGSLIEVTSGVRLVSPFSTANPTITGPPFTATGSLSSFIPAITTTAPNAIQFSVDVNGQSRWWDGFKWAKADGTYANSSTTLDVADNASQLDLMLNDEFVVRAFLHSDSGAATPEIDTLAVTFVQEVTPTMADVSKNVLGNQVVDMSVGTVLTAGVVTKILVTLKSAEALAPSSTQFITDNNLVPEILVKAGLPRDGSFTTLNETSSNTQGDLFVVEVELTP